MVKLVDAFTKQFGRAPTMKELDEMHALKNDQQKLLELKKKVEQKVIEEAQTVKPRRRHPVPLRLPKNAKIVAGCYLRFDGAYGYTPLPGGVAMLARVWLPCSLTGEVVRAWMGCRDIALVDVM